MNNYSKQIINFILSIIVLIQTTQSLHAGTYKEITNFGENPSNIQMFLYTPDSVAQKPPILVACHWCHGKAQDMYNGSRYVSFADRYGYYVIFPSAISSDGCWDVASAGALTHNGGGDPLGIVSMVRYVIKNFHADSTRIFAVGVSSGAMMTNVLLGAYPDVFSAGAVFAGVPFGCFAGPNSWNDDCAKGRIIKQPQQWGDLVREAYTGYTGKRPKIQLWHGTNDEVLDFKNLGEEVKQWTNVFGIDTVPATKENDVFQTGWTRQRYKNNKNEVVVETIIEQGQPHNLQVLQEEALAFLGLDRPLTDVHFGAMLKKNNMSNMTVTTSVKNSSFIDVTIHSVRGNASMSLYTLDGRQVYSLSDIYSSYGLHTFTLNKSNAASASQNAHLYIMKIAVNGKLAGAYRIMF